MSNSLNRCEFIGNLGSDPDTRYTQGGTAVTNFSVACNRSWKDKQTGEKKEQTDWIRIATFSSLAEICGEYLRKGSKVFVAGRMQTRKYQNKEGRDVYSTEIVANEMQMLDSKGDSQGGGQGGNQPGAQTPPRQNQQPPQQRQAPPQNQPPQQGDPGFDDDLDDDIPF